MQGKDVAVADSLRHEWGHRLAVRPPLHADVAHVEIEQNRFDIKLQRRAKNGPAEPLRPLVRRKKLSNRAAQRRLPRGVGPVDDVDPRLQVLERKARRLQTVQPVDDDPRKVKSRCAHADASCSTSFRMSFQACRPTRSRLASRSAGASPAEQGVRRRLVRLLHRGVDPHKQLLHRWIRGLGPRRFQLQEQTGQKAGQILAAASRLEDRFPAGCRRSPGRCWPRRRLPASSSSSMRSLQSATPSVALGFSDEPQPQHEAREIRTLLDGFAERGAHAFEQALVQFGLCLSRRKDRLRTIRNGPATGQVASPSPGAGRAPPSARDRACRLRRDPSPGATPDKAAAGREGPHRS